MKKGKGLIFFWASLLVFFANEIPFALAEFDYPNRPIELVIPYNPGGPVDISCTAFKEKVGKILGQPIVANYKTGAGGALGNTYVARSKPDGYTLLGGTTSSMVILPLTKNIGYTLSDFVPICNLAETREVLAVREDSPYKTFHDFMQAARTKKMKYAGQGPFTIPHILMEVLGKKAGVEFTQIPYSGASTTMAAALGGHVDMGIAGGSAGMVGPGKLRLLAVTGEKRFELCPEIPTLNELGYPVGDWLVYFSIWAPKGTPKEIINRIYEAHKKVAEENRKEIVNIYKVGEMALHLLSSEELGKDYQREYEFYKKTIGELGLTHK